MKIKLSKSAMSDIDNAFKVLKENPNSEVGINMIKISLENCFDSDFNISIINQNDGNNGYEGRMFVMSVFPEISVIDKIISAVNSDNNIDSIKKLWETNKKWYIEIDGRLFMKDFIDCTERELTAILLHEIGHIAYSNDLPNRISTIFKYELLKAKFKNRMLLKDKLFRMIMSLPILDACINDSGDISSIKEEIKADTFVKKMGYTNELLSILNKILKKYKTTTSNSNKLKTSTDYSMNMIDELRQRQNALVKKRLVNLKKYVESTYISNIFDEIDKQIFESNNSSISSKEINHLEYINEKVDNIIDDNCYMEFFNFHTKKLKKIESYEIDYCAIKIEDCKTVTDKLMITTYITSKLDLVDYYLSIMENPKLVKKYSIPHSKGQLMEYKKRLELLRDRAINFKLPEKDKHLLIKWPQNYEG